MTRKNVRLLRMAAGKHGLEQKFQAWPRAPVLALLALGFPPDVVSVMLVS